MLYWALVFLVISIIAGAMGFFGAAADSAMIARTLFYIFIVLFVISLLYSLLTGKKPPVA